MKFIEEKSLENITGFLTAHQVGEKVISGRVEAFSCESVRRGGRGREACFPPQRETLACPLRPAAALLLSSHAP